MAIDFPTSPSPGQQVTSGSRTWTWSGTYWANNTITGVQGTQGIQGTQGTQGVQGIQGLLGTQGSQGLQGIQGIQGITGAQGIQGIQGTQGTQGLQGIMGAQGAQGTQGTQGAQGIQGTQGTQGLQGITGAQGISGASILGTANTWTNTNAFTTISASGAIDASSSGVQALDGVAWAESGFTQNRGSYRAQSSTQNPGLHVVSTSGLPSQGVFSASTARGTLSALTATQVFDGLVLNMRSYGGSTWVNAARIELFGSDTHTETSRPTFITFLTTAVNSVSNAERMRIDASGNVGIGTSSPLAKLNVIGDVKIGDGSNSRGLNLLQNYMSLGETENSATTILGNNIKATDGVNSTVQVSASANDGSVWVALNYSNGITFNRIAAAAIGTQYSENAGELMRITTAGNVGIGTTSPTSKLHIRNTAGSGVQTPVLQLTDTGSALNNGAVIDFSYATTNILNARIGALSVVGGGGALTFAVAASDGAATSEYMRITKAGNVGIGTTSPSQKLDVVGKIFSSTEIQASGAVMNTSGGYASFGSNSGATPIRIGRDTTSNDIIINASGNVGIGNTAPTSLLALSTGSGAGSDATSTGTLQIRQASTGLANGGGLEFHASTFGSGYGFKWSAIDNSGVHLVLGSRENSATWTERLRITSSGNLVYGSYHNSIEYSISVGIAATQWIKLCGINNPGQVVIKGHCGSNNSEESWEINVRETYTTTKTVISCQRQSYNPHIQEVRVEGSDGLERTIYIKIRAADYAPNCSWRILDCRGTPVVYNTNTTPVGAVYAAITVSGEKVYSTNEDITTAGALSKGSGSFRIEHPLLSKSETHELVHSFIEGPQADLIYRGKATLVNGAASVNIDTSATMTEGTFEALCREVQCFTTNESGWTAIRGKVTGNILTIQAQDSTCTDEISWMVIGERKDKHMMDTEWTDENGKVIVEPLKTIKETAETRDV
jgi:hypothetical protein